MESQAWQAWTSPLVAILDPLWSWMPLDLAQCSPGGDCAPWSRSKLTARTLGVASRLTISLLGWTSCPPCAGFAHTQRTAGTLSKVGHRVWGVGVSVRRHSQASLGREPVGTGVLGVLGWWRESRFQPFCMH